MKTVTFTAAAAIALALSAVSPAQAAPFTTSCPGTRVFSIAILLDGASCEQTGEGNLTGNPLNGDAFLTANTNYLLLDKSDTEGGALNGVLAGTPATFNGTLLGSFTIGDTTGYKNLAIAFKSGGMQNSPDWAVFMLPKGTVGGDWKITGAQQALSHALLYGEACSTADPACMDTPPCDRDCGNGDVPEPASLALLGLGLLGAGMISRRAR